MKTKTLLSFLALGISLSTFSQKPTVELTFTAQNNEQYVPLDSIFIENLTQGGDTTLYAPDTVLVLDYLVGVGESETMGEKTFSVSQNYPNPFKGKTKVNLYLPEKDEIKITVRDILGRDLAYYENTFQRGNHTFAFDSDNQKYYLLTITGRKTSQTIKMLNSGSRAANGEKCQIEYTGTDGNASVFKSQNAMNDFGFNLGDELKFTAYALTANAKLGSAVIVDAPEVSKIYEFDILGGLRCPETHIVTDIEGNTYNTVQIGNQCWLKENLKTATYNNGASIPNVTDPDEWSNLTSGAFVWNDNDIAWKDIYGALYNYYTVNNPNGLCPTGWHVPSRAEWLQLVNYVESQGFPNTNVTNGAGSALKSCRQVDSPLGGDCNTTEHPRWAPHNTFYGFDEFGFSGLGGGFRNFIGQWDPIGFNGIYWSSTASTTSDAWVRFLHSNYGYISGDGFGYSKVSGFSVRCLRD